MTCKLYCLYKYNYNSDYIYKIYNIFCEYNFEYNK